MHFMLAILKVLAVVFILQLKFTDARILTNEVWDHHIRLLNGTTPWEGEVEIKINGTWGTICTDDASGDDGWSILDGDVACRQLGYDTIISIFSQVDTTQRNGQAVYQGFNCTGREQHLKDCLGTYDMSVNHCQTSGRAWVRCQRPVTKTSPVTCMKTQFKCLSEDKCIPRRWVCDHQNDCKDQSDENKLFCNNHCGTQRTSPLSHRVSGGTNAKLGTWPWMASLEIEFHNAVSASYLCGGTLIDQRWVLTAAHCFDDYTPTSTSLRVILGGINVNINEVNERILQVQNVIIHRAYNPTSYENDIALIKLKHSVETSHPDITPACIKLPDEDQFDSTNICYVIGFGDTGMEGRNKQGILQQAMVPIINNTACSQWYQQSIADSNICAGYSFGGIDACKGDSGGPLSCYKDGKWYVTGIVSWGEGCANARRPGVYTNVIYYVSWIIDVIRRHNILPTTENLIG
ncbi:Plasma kallikrein [Mactra antiquata]